MGNRKAILYLPPYAHEHDRLKELEGKLTAEARKLGIREVVDTIVKKIKPGDLPLGSIVVTDSSARLGRKVGEAAAWLGAALQRGINVIMPGYFTLQTTDPTYHKVAAVLDTLNRTANLHRAKRVSEGVFLSRQRGVPVGRPPLNEQTRDLIVETYARIGSVRGSVRSLRAKGVNVGRSSVQRVLAAVKKDKGGDK
ncbi:MAG TPA: hypothetical protein VJB59_05005 [Bdellovibrionota bacterium]|nr:hypothetical protein [Bdellovibrionota bacterium]